MLSVSTQKLSLVTPRGKIHAYGEKLARELWDVSAQLVGLEGAVARAA
jgi:hypothetical protein